MENSNENLDFAKATALYAYLELCNTLNEVPRKESYDLIHNAESSEDLEKITVFMEIQEAQYLKDLKAFNEKKEPLKQTLLSKIKDLLK
ncbi:hypothetical protein [Chryseobacterium sp.]|uniref:hypothetical protein n=1 Tax=Chryseobacterium sp. TaxID=1871047 RepID=UPI0028968595|nr:hypothetical protein [Chryseobacterium sp.]